MNTVASLFIASSLVGGFVPPGAPTGSSDISPLATTILPEPPTVPPSNEQIEFSTTALLTPVISGAVILLEPRGDMDPTEPFSIWSDVVIFRTDNNGNSFADLYSSVMPTETQTSFITSTGQTIMLPANLARIPEATSGRYTTYIATGPAGTNTYLIESVSPIIPEPSSLLLLSMALSGVAGFTACRRVRLYGRLTPTSWLSTSGRAGCRTSPC